MQKIALYFCQGNKLYEGIYGEKDANQAGEWMSMDPKTEDIMVFVDSDSIEGAMGFMKLSKN